MGAVPFKYLWCRYSGQCSVDMLLLAQYHFNTCGGTIVIGAVWVCCCGCNAMLIQGGLPWFVILQWTKMYDQETVGSMHSHYKVG